MHRNWNNNNKHCLIIIVVCLFLFTAPSASTNSSPDGVFWPQFPSQRRLLQAKKPCPVNFENENYTIITSQCKEPYSVQLCCSSFKQFACPFVDYLDESSTDCAETMFGYINSHGNYPPGLFASLCREGEEGLLCPDPPPPPSSLSEKDYNKREILTSTIIIAATFVMLIDFV
ncbi:hypothetical protein ACP275_08G170000 [Erythranthe tilingii]